MKTGIILPQFGSQATKENTQLDSLWVIERLFWPINPQTPYAGSPNDMIPTIMQYVFDPLETLW
jgi:hypothetical protein